MDKPWTSETKLRLRRWQWTSTRAAPRRCYVDAALRKPAQGNPQRNHRHRDATAVDHPPHAARRIPPANDSTMTIIDVLPPAEWNVVTIFKSVINRWCHCLCLGTSISSRKRRAIICRTSNVCQQVKKSQRNQIYSYETNSLIACCK